MGRSTARWLGVALAVGLVYPLVSIVSGSLAAAATSTAGRTRWRLMAWAISAVVFAAQIAYERLRLLSRVGTASLHAAVGAAFGGFFLAGAATIHKMSVDSVDARYFLALVLWPLAVALPAFAGALVLSAVIRPRKALGPHAGVSHG
jgi:hypothetical protein